MSNGNLHNARKAKKDEFYTRLEDIADELHHYREHFRGKSVLLNCDDPEWSNFWKYFELKFDELGLARLISTHYRKEGPSYKLVMERNEDGKLVKTKTPLEGNGDFRSPECVALLEEADIITTNPPFSLFREYVALLVEHDKKFVIIGNQNCITYKELFPVLERDEIWLGVNNGPMEFEVPSDYPKIKRVDDSDPNHPRYYTKLGNICWFTNLDIDKRHDPLPLYDDYDPTRYPKYDNYDAIEVGKVAEIPADYYGVMGVPITFLDKHCPEQFRLIGFWNAGKAGEAIGAGKCQAISKNKIITWNGPTANGRTLYFRILIQRVDQPISDTEGVE